MTMTAKFSGRCSACGGSIHAGDKIDWEKGKGARHDNCSAGTSQRRRSSAPRARAAAPRFRARDPRECAAGEQLIQRRSAGRDDGYDVGTTIHAAKVPGGGGPDGHYWTVVDAGKSPPCDDLDIDEWTCWAIVRPATDAEAAPVAARIEARAAYKADTARLREIARLCMAGTRTDDAPLPPGGLRVVYDPRVGVGGTQLAAPSELRVDGDEVRAWEAGSYDDWRRAHGTVVDAALADEVRAIAARRAQAVA